MTTATKPITAHSHSRLQMFSQCPLSYKLAYIDKVPQESSSALEIGAAAHEFFDQWISYLAKGAVLLNGNPVELIAAKCFQKEARDQDNFKEYLEICQIFAKAYKPDPKYPYVVAEKQWAFNRQWELCPWMDPEVMFRAKIDLIEFPEPPETAMSPIKKIRITDYKTGYAGSMNSFQLDIYAFVAKLVYPELEQIEVQFFYTKSGFKQVKLLEVKDMDITKIQLEALMERIEGETKWKPKPGARCLNCSVAAACTAKPSDLKAITSPADAQALATEIAFLEAQAKAKKKPLNAYCKAAGPVEAGGLVWSHYPTESMVVQIAPLLSVCVAHEVDPGEILNPDTTKFKKLCRQNPSFAEAISPYTGVETGSRFYAKKAEPDDE